MRLKKGDVSHYEPVPYVTIWCDGSSDHSPLAADGATREPSHERWVVRSFKFQMIGTDDFRIVEEVGARAERGSVVRQRGWKGAGKIVLNGEVLDSTDPRAAYDPDAGMTFKLTCDRCGLDVPVTSERLTGALGAVAFIAGKSTVKLADLAAILRSNRFTKQ